VSRLLASTDTQTAEEAEREIGSAAAAYVKEMGQGQTSTLERVDAIGGILPADWHFPLSTFSDAQILQLNSMLPWAAMTVDEHGRTLGSPWSSEKRANPQTFIEKRQIAFNAAFPLAGKHVLEVGCFEGIHTIGCLNLGARVTAVDSRMENLVKTLVRLWCYGRTADLKLWDLEEESPADVPKEWDVLHHVGVLYHLTDPVRHLQDTLSRTKDALLLDTHIATDEAGADRDYEVDGKRYRYFYHGEKNASPFAGVRDHAKWLLLEDLVETIKQRGFNDVRVVSDRAERNGRRITLWAFRCQ
jgi:tRNA (mo5U34)-methyltransferase